MISMKENVNILFLLSLFVLYVMATMIGTWPFRIHCYALMHPIISLPSRYLFCERRPYLTHTATIRWLSSGGSNNDKTVVVNANKTVSGVASRAKLLPNVLRYRGSVDQGYGRGGKKLGVPTANLPASLFQNALEDVQTGVYFGWAALERDGKTKAVNEMDKNIFKTVVNVGYSPTFEGQENSEKIIEAHLIVDKDKNEDGEPQQTEAAHGNDSPSPNSNGSIIKDFYGVPMRLQLIGFLRDEKKFDTFPELIEQIHADVEDAKVSLDFSPYKACRNDPFFRISTTVAWVGKGGGNETASWEEAPMKSFLESVATGV